MLRRHLTDRIAVFQWLWSNVFHWVKSLDLWAIAKELHSRLSIFGSTLPSCPIWKNPLMTAGGKPIFNRIWQQKNITKLCQLLSDGNNIGVNELKLQYKSEDAKGFQYILLKVLLKSEMAKGITLKHIDTADKKLREAVKGTVSKLYKLLS